MSTNPQLEAFLRRVKGDSTLLNRFHSASCLDDIAAMGAEMGFQFSGVDVLVHQASATLKLPAEALEALAAGVELEGHLWKMDIQWT
jgi:predicted ribosomally synthesized peptide with nif11-like leader